MWQHITYQKLCKKKLMNDSTFRCYHKSAPDDITKPQRAGLTSKQLTDSLRRNLAKVAFSGGWYGTAFRPYCGRRRAGRQCAANSRPGTAQLRTVAPISLSLIRCRPFLMRSWNDAATSPLQIQQSASAEDPSHLCHAQVTKTEKNGKLVT